MVASQGALLQHYSLLICVPWEVFPMCYPSLAHVGKSFGTLSYVLYVYFVLDFG